MFGIAGHWPELLVILVIALLFIGPGKLPQVGSAFGKTIKGFRKGLNEDEEAEVAESTAKK